MTTKESILALFEEQKGKYFSGEEIATRLSVSRAAVWKAVKSLRKEGYVIDAVQNKGYCLSTETDILSVQGIQKYLDSEYRDLDIYVLAEVKSTNTAVRERAEAGISEGCVIIANSQLNGKGRLQRKFYSPADTGIYMSLLLRPEGITPGQATKITTMAAVAVCEAVEEVSGKEAWIKWVNDIYLEQKKVSGILTEASISMESGSVQYVILGIGMNVYPPKSDFPPEIRETAGTIFGKHQNDGKNQLAAAVLNNFLRLYKKRNYAEYVEKYRAKSLVIGKEILVMDSNRGKKAVALDIDEECHLIVQYENGETDTLSAGEISIRI